MLEANALKLLCLWRFLKHFYWLYEKTIQRAQVHPGILRPKKTLPLWNSSNKSYPIGGINPFKKQTTNLSWKSSQTGYQTKSDLKIQCTLTCWLLQWFIQPSWISCLNCDPNLKKATCAGNKNLMKLHSLNTKKIIRASTRPCTNQDRTGWMSLFNRSTAWNNDFLPGISPHWVWSLAVHLARNHAPNHAKRRTLSRNRPPVTLSGTLRKLYTRTTRANTLASWRGRRGRWLSDPTMLMLCFSSQIGQV